MLIQSKFKQLYLFFFFLSFYFHHCLAHSFLQAKTVREIKLYNDLPNLWGGTQVIDRYDYNLLIKDDGLIRDDTACNQLMEYLKYHKIKITKKNIWNSLPCYNSRFDSDLKWGIKNPDKGLQKVYFTCRKNPFNLSYQNLNNTFTLEDLLNNKVTIQSAYIFWDAKQHIMECNKIIVPLDCYPDEFTQDSAMLSTKIKNWIKEKNIFCDSSNLRSFSYNVGMDQANCYFINLQEGRKLEKNNNNIYNDELIYYVHFDEGIRIFYPSQGGLNDLLKLPNGAKNVYLFTFNIAPYPIEEIILEDNEDPITFINTFVCKNKLDALLLNIETQEFVESLVENTNHNRKAECQLKYDVYSVIFKLKNSDKKLKIICSNKKIRFKDGREYLTKLINWKNQCYIKPGTTYSGDYVRDKLGKTDRDVYNEYGTTYLYGYNVRKPWQADDFGIDGIDQDGKWVKKYFVRAQWDCCTHHDNRFYRYYFDTSRPPQKPNFITIKG